jgi:hypothetical protein
MSRVMPLLRSPRMSGLHSINAILLVAVNALAGIVGLVTWRRRVEPRAWFTHLVALGQVLLVAQVALGLMLLSDDRRSSDQLHYLYGTLALLAVLSPWFYAGRDPARRVVWFAGAALLAAALGLRALITGE